VGIAVAKKVGSKPRRNHLKRRIRAAVRSSETEINPKLDYVIVVSSEALDAVFERIEEDVRNLFREVAKRWADELESS